MTEKLYDTNSYLTEFEALVMSCHKTDKGYRILLDKTGFFPTEGGQECDSGTIDGAVVKEAELCGDEIYHYTDVPLEEGKTIKGSIDFAERYRKMQNHTGEHIICGIAHKLYGCENVGFHLGKDYVTMDLDKPLTEEELCRIEVLANEAVYANKDILAYYPSEKELERTDFRSKDGISGKVRLVVIEGYDICACCAPHVSKTGEVGIIKILDHINYKGGVRLNILCGSDALKDYHERYKRNSHISALLSAKQEDVCLAVEKLLADMAELRNKLGEKSKEITRLQLESIKETDGNLWIFAKDMSGGEIRHLANGLKEKTKKIAAVFCGDDGNYNYIMTSAEVDVKPLSAKINTQLNGRGGGNSQMIQGSVSATQKEIESFMKSL